MLGFLVVENDFKIGFDHDYLLFQFFFQQITIKQIFIITARKCPKKITLKYTLHVTEETMLISNDSFCV